MLRDGNLYSLNPFSQSRFLRLELYMAASAKCLATGWHRLGNQLPPDMGLFWGELGFWMVLKGNQEKNTSFPFVCRGGGGGPYSKTHPYPLQWFIVRSMAHRF